MLDVAVIESAAAAEAALDPIRARLLAQLREPASAASVAVRIGLPRQKVNYHLRMLENFGLLDVFAGTAQWQRHPTHHGRHRTVLRHLPGGCWRSPPSSLMMWAR